MKNERSKNTKIVPSGQIVREILGSYSDTVHPYVALAYASTGMSNVEIAKNMGISHITFQKWLREHERFADFVKKGRAGIVMQIESALYMMAMPRTRQKRTYEISNLGEKILTKVEETDMDPNLNAVIFMLRTLKPEKWKTSDTDVLEAGDVKVVVESEDADL